MGTPKSRSKFQQIVDRAKLIEEHSKRIQSLADQEDRIDVLAAAELVRLAGQLQVLIEIQK